jgi:cytochrome c553
MKSYATGQRKHDLMRLVVSGLSEGEMRNIASYYARQTRAGGDSPVGDASAGRASTGLCAECHGNLGISVAPAFPSLAGQDAQYLADAIHAYKAGSRQKRSPAAHAMAKTVSARSRECEPCRPEPHYLVPAMQALPAASAEWRDDSAVVGCR